MNWKPDMADLNRKRQKFLKEEADKQKQKYQRSFEKYENHVINMHKNCYDRMKDLYIKTGKFYLKNFPSECNFAIDKSYSYIAQPDRLFKELQNKYPSLKISDDYREICNGEGGCWNEPIWDFRVVNPNDNLDKKY